MKSLTSSLETLPYHSYSLYLMKKYGRRVHKITVDAGFTCPNRDGTKAFGGCSYCDNASFSPQVRFTETESVRTQLEKGKKHAQEMNGSDQFIAYFQAFTNTYADLETLKKIYDQCLIPGVVGLAIGTRPDCITPEIVELLSSYTEHFPVWLELGLQTIHEQSQLKTNRWQTNEDFYQALDMLEGSPLEICVHVILGLNGETRDMMLDTAKVVAAENIHSIKIHHLYVTPHSIMEKEWKAGKIEVLTIEEYVSLVVDFLEQLPPDVVIERLMGELSREYALAPNWGLGKPHILHKICQEFERRGTRQGSLWKPQEQAVLRKRFLTGANKLIS